MMQKTMKFLSSVESWNSLFEWASVGLVALTFVAGAGTLITSRIIRDRQAEKIGRLGKDVTDAQTTQKRVETDLAQAKTGQAEAERSLLELKTRLAFRSIDAKRRKQMSEALRRFAPQAFEITTYTDDQECMSFAAELANMLIDAGWKLIPTGGWLAFSLVTDITVEFGEARKQDFGAAAEARTGRRGRIAFAKSEVKRESSHSGC